MELSRILPNLRFPPCFLTELEVGRAPVPVPPFARQLLRVPASILRLNRNDVLIAVPIEEIDTELLELAALQHIVNRPQNLFLHLGRTPHIHFQSRRVWAARFAAR
jgi:hypothetical protein